MREELVQDGVCNNCGAESGDKYYIFCSIECQRVWWEMNEQDKKFAPDLEHYNAWFENRTKTIEAMETREEVEKRIKELQDIHFYTTREWSMLHERFYKIVGHKGIPLYIKKQRDALITDPDIKPNYEGEPRKKPAKSKDKESRNSMYAELKQQAMDKMAGRKKAVIEGTSDLSDDMKSLLVPQPVLSEEEKQEKVNAFKEKMRIARENAQKKVG